MFLRKKFVYLDSYTDKDKQIVLTFDDGLKNIKKYVSPILSFFKIPYELFICTDFVQKNDKSFLNFNDLLFLEKRGASLQYHTKSHLKLYEITDIKLIEDEIICPDYLKKTFKTHFLYFAYPYWQFNDTILSTVKKYYKGARSGNGFALKNNLYAMDSVKITNTTNLKELFNV